MRAAFRRHLTAGLALATAGVVIVAAPTTTPAPELSTTRAVTLRTAEESPLSLLNVPLNLFQDIVNIPYNELQALNVMAQSLLFTGPWFFSSPTNIWGEDPGDPGHFESLIDLFVPFPELSGLGHEGDYSYPGLGEQIAMLAAVEIPANASCASLQCLPVIPTAPITGLTSWDQGLWGLLIITGIQKFPLFNDWFKVPLSELTKGDGFYFSPGGPESIDSGPAYAYPGFPWPGTHNPSPEELAQYPNLTPDSNLMPWAGTTFKLDLAAPFHNFFTSLLQPFDANNFELPQPLDIGRALQAVLAGLLLDFNPFVYASPVCPGPCVLPDGTQTYEGFMKFVGAMWPGNSLIDEWQQLYSKGMANVSTPEILSYLTWMWQHDAVPFDFYNGRPEPFGNSLPPDPAIDTSKTLPTMDEVNDWITAHYGKPVDTFLNNVGILAPFDSPAVWDTFLPFLPWSTVTSTFNELETNVESLVALTPAFLSYLGDLLTFGIL